MSPELDPLRSSYLLHGLQPGEIEAVVSLARVERKTASEQIVALGERDGDLIFVLTGEADILTHDGDKLGSVGAGGVVGEISFLDGQPRNAHVVCRSLTTFARWPAADLRRLMNAQRSLGFILLANLARVVTARLRSADARLDDFMDTDDDVWHHAL